MFEHVAVEAVQLRRREIAEECSSQGRPDVTFERGAVVLPRCWSNACVDGGEPLFFQKDVQRELGGLDVGAEPHLIAQLCDARSASRRVLNPPRDFCRRFPSGPGSSSTQKYQEEPRLLKWPFTQRTVMGPLAMR